MRVKAKKKDGWHKKEGRGGVEERRGGEGGTATPEGGGSVPSEIRRHAAPLCHVSVRRQTGLFRE